MNNAQLEIDAACRMIYAQTSEFPPVKRILGDQFGFEILMGRPFIEAPVLFIGYQPGNWALSVSQARHAGYERDWVVNDKSQYATENWRLAIKLRAIFGPENISVLEKSVGLNAIYVRAKNVLQYTKSVTLDDRKLIQSYCINCNQQIIQLIKPKKIIVIGFGAMDVFGPSTPDVLGYDNRCLTKLGLICDQEALAIRHLTGARFTSADYAATTDRIRKFLELS